MVLGHIWQCALCFESVVYGDICVEILHVYGSFKVLVQGCCILVHTCADAGPLKVKYLVKAEKLRHNLQSGPSI